MVDYIINQLNIFGAGGYSDRKELINIKGVVLSRLQRCLTQHPNYIDDGGSREYTLYGDRYAILLYYLSNELYKNGSDLATSVYLLNKALHGIDLFYEVEMPEVFELVHPVGTVLGRAKYSNGLQVYQGVNIGSNKGVYPVIGENFTAHPGATILGNCNIGNNCAVGAGSVLLDMDLPDATVYVGNPLQYRLLKR